MHVRDVTAALEYTLRNTLSSSALFLQATESCMMERLTAWCGSSTGSGP